MAGHYPFSGNTNRVSVFAFYDRHGLGLELQEKYYKWWFDWAKNFVLADADLKFAKGAEFSHFPYGQHAHHDFHLNQYQWCTTMIDLGQFIKGVIMPKMSADQLHKLEEDHRHMLDELKKEAAVTPKKPSPEIGYFRHT
jgi:hypothetical protein